MNSVDKEERPKLGFMLDFSKANNTVENPDTLLD